MPRCSLRQVSLPKRAHQPVLPRPQHFHATAASHSATVLALPDLFTFPANSNDLKTTLLTTKYADLRTVLTWAHPAPSRVWGCYIDLLNLMGFEKLPVEIHQAVLRRCSPPTDTLRAALSRRVASKTHRGAAHLHEIRFQGIIRNIRAFGAVPALEDYHFILEQFAAVGHHTGAMAVFDEIVQLGLKKTTRTYGLCLQALCHRLSLPCWHRVREQLVLEVTRSCVRLLNEMGKHDVPFTSVNVDLVVRILKESADLNGFEKLMRVAYGIDLSYPDRPPLEHWDKDDSRSVTVTEDASAIHLPQPLPFSTAALNTTVDMLGRHGEISKLVQTFEVLTTPLPSGSSGTPAFDEDDEDDFGVLNPRVASFAPRFAKPNTSTYHMLIKWVSRAGHAVLARHYVLQAMALDREVDYRLRRECRRLPPEQILAPHFGINRSMLLPVFAEANRDKNMELMRWILVKTQRILRRKRSDIAYYRAIQESWRTTRAAKRSAEDALLTATTDASATRPEVNNDARAEPSPESGSVFSTFFSPSSSSQDVFAKTAATPHSTPYFDVDLDAVDDSSPPPPKLFDINIHLNIIERDVDMLEKFERHVTDIVGRTTQRVKERLGRRVWDGKDVYLRDEDKRVTLTRDQWRQKVQFREERAIALQESSLAEGDSRHRWGTRDRAPHQRAGWLAGGRGFITSATQSASAFRTLRDPLWR